MPLINFEKYNVLMDKSYTSQLGKVAKVVGLTIESIGPSAKLNDLCLIRSNNRTEPVKAEVVGFRDDRVLLMPYDDVEGVGLGSWAGCSWRGTSWLHIKWCRRTDDRT